MFATKRLRRWTALLLAAALLLGMSAPALAASLARVTGTSMVYKSADTASAELGTVKKGTYLTLEATNGDWAKVALDGNTGYMALADLSEAEVITGYVTGEKLTVYAKNNVKSGQLGTLQFGQTIDVAATKGAWAMVTVDGRIGYCQVKYLAKEAPNGDAKPNEETETAVPIYVAAEYLPVYNSNSTASTLLGTMRYGDEMGLIATKGDWCKVTLSGRVGFCKKSGLTMTKPSHMSVKAYVQANNTKVHESASASAAVLMTLAENACVTVVSVTEDDVWCRLKNGSHYGYVKKSELAETQANAVKPIQSGDSGSEVTKLQTRLKALGYFAGEVTGSFGSLTGTALKLFQKTNDLSATGVADEATQNALYSEGAKKAPESAAVSTSEPAGGSVKEMDWWTSGIQTIFDRGVTATVTDVETGISWREIRKGGTNHADVQPVTAADTAAMKKAVGGTWSWQRRAIWVTINGQRYAASMNCMPHGSGSISDNNYNGHHCIHFTNSRTHGTNSIDSAHQAAIKKALAAG